MLYDIMGHNTSDLLIMDIYDYFKQIPDPKNDDIIKQRMKIGLFCFRGLGYVGSGY